MTEVQPPRTILVARWLWLGSAALSAVRSLITLADREELRTQLWKVDASLSMAAVERAVNAEILFGLLISAVILGLYVMLANRMARGRNWARIVLTVFGVSGVVLGALGMVGVASGMLDLQVGAIDIALSLLSLGVNATAVVYMFLPASAAHFATSGRPRATVRW